MIKFIRQRWLPYLLLTISVLIWSGIAGKEMGWDTFNHHFYIPYAWLTGRIDTDYFGAGPQSYQNPSGYLFFYYLIGLNMPSWAVGAALALAHSTNAWISYKIAKTLWDLDGANESWVLLAAAGALITPAFLQMAGTSYSDPILAIPVLLSLLFVVKESSMTGVITAGLLAGGAFGAKQSNAVFVLAIAAAVGYLSIRKRSGWRAAPAFLIAAAAGATLVSGWWAWALWKKFANPIFPLYNNLFKSVYATQDVVIASRFVARDWQDFFSRLWELSLPISYVYQEACAPDIRPIALSCVAVFAAYRILKRKKAINFNCTVERTDVKLEAILVFSFVTYFLWMLTSGNSRYASPLFMIVPVALARWVFLLLPSSLAIYLISIITILQAINFYTYGSHRYFSEPWSANEYYQVSIPDLLIKEPYLHIVMGMQTNAVLVKYLHPGGAMTNPIGQFSIPIDGPAGAPLRKLLSDWKGRVRFLIPGAIGTEKELAEKRVLYSEVFARIALDVNWASCLKIAFSSSVPSLYVDGMPDPAQSSLETRVVQSCSAIPSGTSWRGHAAAIQKADEKFAEIEDTCPLLLNPRPLVSERGVKKWQRFYSGTDTILTISDSGPITLRNSRKNDDIYLGNTGIPAKESAFLWCK